MCHYNPGKCKSMCPTEQGEVSMKGRATEKCNIIEYPLKDKTPYNITQAVILIQIMSVTLFKILLDKNTNPRTHLFIN